jgi:hypothetical protein
MDMKCALRLVTALALIAIPIAARAQPSSPAGSGAPGSKAPVAAPPGDARGDRRARHRRRS